MKDKERFFSGKQKQRAFIARRCTLQGMLKGGFSGRRKVMEVRHLELQKAETSVEEGRNGAKRTSFTFLIP